MQAYDDWFGSRSDGALDHVAHALRVLLVDDSPFFRNLLTPLLTIAGYEVTAVESADRALQLHEVGEDFDVIISDIEMPGMNGFEFAAQVRSDTRWRHVPMVALSSHATPEDLDRGRAVGFNDYIAKFDRDALLTSLSATLTLQREVAA
jgi:two-component system chemotaxis sensor kinase CheA